MNMPAIAEQVATMEHDLQEALAKIDSLTAEKELLTKALTAVTSEKSDLEAKYDDMQLLVDDTREMVDKLAGMTLDVLRTSRRKVTTPQLNNGDGKSKDDGARSGEQTDATTRPRPDCTGEDVGLRHASPPEGMTAAHRLRAGLLLDTAPGALMRSPRAELSDDLPMFLHQPMSPPQGVRRAKVMA
jgi:hypothetical protein